jgi:hypothetical protein
VSTALKILLPLFSVLLVAVLFVMFVGVLVPELLTYPISPGAAFSWDNFDPLSGEPGLLGLSPLIWTALVVVPTAMGLPLLIYLFEKKRVPGIARAVLAVTRMVVLLLLYLLMAGPSLVDSETYVEGSKVAILIDDSLSMGAESREFPIFNVLDGRESKDVADTRAELERLGIKVDRPPSAGFVTLTEDELLVRNFVRRVVRERSARLVERLRELHKQDFRIGAWQQLRADVVRISQEADLLQSALAAETSKKKSEEDTEFDGEIRRLQTALDSKLLELSDKEAEFGKLLGGDA